MLHRRLFLSFKLTINTMFKFPPTACVCTHICIQLYLIFVHKLLPTFQIFPPLGLGSQKENYFGSVLCGTVSGFLIQTVKLLSRKTMTMWASSSCMEERAPPDCCRGLWQPRTISFLPVRTSFCHQQISLSTDPGPCCGVGARHGVGTRQPRFPLQSSLSS